MKIFYSWQSDLPNNTNRGFIEDALERAVKAIRNDNSLQVEPVIDRDTSGVPGSPNIAQTILDKIAQSDIFVADVSIINAESDGRPTPNPNVLVELGYALKCLGSKMIILVQNTVFGSPETLPFDLRMNRVITYSLNSEDSKASARMKLVKHLEDALRLMIKDVETRKTIKNIPVEKEILDILSAKNKIQLNSYLSEKTRYLGMQLSQSSLTDISSQPTEEELVKRVKWVNSVTDEMVRIFISSAPWLEQDQFQLYGRVLERVTSYAQPTSGRSYTSWKSFQNYPALRIFYSAGISALAENALAFIKYLALTLKIDDRIRDNPSEMILELNVPTVFSDNLGKLLPEMSHRLTPGSDYMLTSLRQYFLDEFPNDDDFTRLFDRFEYLIALVYAKTIISKDSSWFWAPLGSFVWRGRGDISSRLAREILEQGTGWEGIQCGMFDSEEQVQYVIHEVGEIAKKHPGAW